MKKQLLGSLVLGTILLANANASVERIGGYVGFDAIEEHSQEATYSSEKEEYDHDEEYEDEAEYEEESSSSQAQSILGVISSQVQSSYSSAIEEAHDEYSSAKEESEHFYSSAMSEAHEQYSSAKEEAYASYSSAKEEAHEEYSSAKEQPEAIEEHNEEIEDRIQQLMEIVEETIHDEKASQEVKEIAKEIKYTVEFYKKEEMLADLNISDLEDCNETCMNEIRQRVEEAYQERKRELAQEVLKHQTKAQYKVAGYFVKTGEGQYDWAFVTQNGDVYKLAGVDATGHFKYEKVEGKAQVTANGYVYLPGAVSGEGLMFVNYEDPDENGFDWVIVTKDGKLYKLEGYDPDAQTFVYTPVDGVVAEPEGDEVVVLPGT